MPPCSSSHQRGGEMSSSGLVLPVQLNAYDLVRRHTSFDVTVRPPPVVVVIVVAVAVVIVVVVKSLGWQPSIPSSFMQSDFVNHVVGHLALSLSDVHCYQPSASKSKKV